MRDQPLLGHFLHGVLRALAADAALLDAGERNQVDAAARRVVQVHDADVDAARRRQRPGQVAREQSGGEAERRRVHARSALVERRERARSTGPARRSPRT